MESSSPSVLEIISDEEVGFGDTRKCNSYGGGGFGDREDHNWLSEVLGELDKSKDDDCDDVVVVSELFASAKKSKFGRVKNSAKIVDDDGDDDDCVVLDGDPEKPVVVVVVGSGRADGNGDDDLEIIGEKGEVACRDFPHPRHLCAKHPFASTPHNLHCCQCHCYVCDSLAPCACWGTGISNIDHCHATDKDDRWKTERKRMKKLNKPKPVRRRTIDAYFSTQFPKRPPPPQPNSIQPNHGLRPVNVPNVVPTCNLQPQLVPPQLETTCLNNITPKGKTGNSGPQFTSPRAVFKRSGSTGVSPNHDRNRCGLSRDPSLRRCHSLPHHVRNLNEAHSQPQMTSPPFPSGNYVNMVPFQSCVPSQPILGKFHNMILSQPDTVFQPNNPISSDQGTNNNFENHQSSQFEAFGNSPSLLIDGHHNFQQRSQSQSQSKAVSDPWDLDSDSCGFEDVDVYLPEARDILLAGGKNPDLFLPPGW